MKKLFLLFIPFLFLSCSLNNKKLEKPKKIAQKKKIEYKREIINDNIKAVIKDIITLLVSKKLTKLNKKYIHPKYGFYDLFKIEGYEGFLHKDMIRNIAEEEIEELNHILFRANKHARDFAIIEQDVKFNCSPKTDEFYGWNGDGLYISYNTNNTLSEIMKKAKKYSKDELKKVSIIEKYSYKVILTPEIVFYLTKFKNKFYITLFDRISTDCSSPKEE